MSIYNNINFKDLECGSQEDFSDQKIDESCFATKYADVWKVLLVKANFTEVSDAFNRIDVVK